MTILYCKGPHCLAPVRQDLALQHLIPGVFLEKIVFAETLFGSIGQTGSKIAGRDFGQNAVVAHGVFLHALLYINEDSSLEFEESSAEK